MMVRFSLAVVAVSCNHEYEDLTSSEYVADPARRSITAMIYVAFALGVYVSFWVTALRLQ
jgi:hypothetical protein